MYFGLVTPQMAKNKKAGLTVAGIAIILYLFIASMFYAFHRSNKTRENKNIVNYKVYFESEEKMNQDSLLFVGDNSQYYFMYDTTRKEALVIPKEKVKLVKIMRNKDGRIL